MSNLKSRNMPDQAPGIRFLRSIMPLPSKKAFKVHALVLTFLVYTALHMARKPASIVKGVLRPTDSNLPGWAPFTGDKYFML
eukprot:Ihof_evm7s221 gene=Ihof_evmTU7s221